MSFYLTLSLWSDWHLNQYYPQERRRRRTREIIELSPFASPAPSPELLHSGRGSIWNIPMQVDQIAGGLRRKIIHFSWLIVRLSSHQHTHTHKHSLTRLVGSFVVVVVWCLRLTVSHVIGRGDSRTSSGRRLRRCQRLVGSCEEKWKRKTGLSSCSWCRCRASV